MPKLRAGIHYVDGDGKVEMRCGFEWGGGDVKIIVGEDTKVAQRIMQRGVEGCNSKVYKLSDGEAFMRALPFSIRGSMAFADLWEEQDGKWVESEPSIEPADEVGGEANA